MKIESYSLGEMAISQSKRLKRKRGERLIQAVSGIRTRTWGPACQQSVQNSLVLGESYLVKFRCVKYFQSESRNSRESRVKLSSKAHPSLTPVSLMLLQDRKLLLTKYLFTLNECMTYRRCVRGQEANMN